MLCLVARSCPTLCDPTDCSPPGSSVHGDSPARILEWVAISSPRESSHPRDRTCISWISCIGRWILNHWASLVAQMVKNPPALREIWVQSPGSGKILGRSPGGGHGNPLQYSCLENPHGQRSLAGCSPWDHKELEVTEHTQALADSDAHSH